jgi:hypothetical protein
MDETALTQQDKDSRALALEECQRRILEALRKGLQAYKIMSRELTKIQEEELYRVQFERFDDYVRRNFKLEMRDVARIHSIATTVLLLERQGLTLPENETQVLELARLEPEKRGAVWQKMLSLNEREDIPLTSDFIRKAVEKETRLLPEGGSGPGPRAARGVEVSLDLGSGGDGPGPARGSRPPGAPNTERISLTARGEAALTRLRALCGDSLVDALERGSLPMAERDIIRWGEESDAELVRNLVYYVAHLRWTLAKALAYEARLINGDTTVDELITLARARNGRVATKHLDARIVTEILQATT